LLCQFYKTNKIIGNDGSFFCEFSQEVVWIKTRLIQHTVFQHHQDGVRIYAMEYAYHLPWSHGRFLDISTTYCN